MRSPLLHAIGRRVCSGHVATWPLHYPLCSDFRSDPEHAAGNVLGQMPRESCCSWLLVPVPMCRKEEKLSRKGELGLSSLWEELQAGLGRRSGY